MKTWKPDTCECHVEEVYSGTEITGMGAILKKCPAHSSVPDVDLWGVLYANPDGENRRKNSLYRDFLGIDSPSLNLGLSEMNANGVLVLKAGLEYVWSYTGTGKNRILNVSITGATLTTAKKNALQTVCDTKFGPGKVLVS